MKSASARYIVMTLNRPDCSSFYSKDKRVTGGEQCVINGRTLVTLWCERWSVFLSKKSASAAKLVPKELMNVLIYFKMAGLARLWEEKKMFG